MKNLIVLAIALAFTTGAFAQAPGAAPTEKAAVTAPSEKAPEAAPTPAAKKGKKKPAKKAK